MSRGNKFNIGNLSANKETANDIFGEPNVFSIQDLQKTSEKPSMIKRTDLVESPKNPYNVDENSDEMTQLVASIKESGILTPLLARPKGTRYEIISGHRRKKAADILKLKELPVFVRELTDEEADRIMVDMNLNRENILPSEKARAIKLKYEAIKRSRGRKKTGEPKEDAHDSAKIIAKEMGMSDRAIQEYIRLTFLCSHASSAVDEKKIPLKAGVQISYLPKKVQDRIVSLYLGNGYKLDERQAKLIRETYTEEDKDGKILAEKLIEQKSVEHIKKKREKMTFAMPAKIRKKYFPKTMTDRQVDEVMLELLSGWASKHNPDYKG